MDLKCFIVVPPGSEGWAEKELIEHGAEESQIKRYPGGFEFPAALGSLPHWHSSLKIPVRLLVRLFEGKVTTWEDLGSALSQVPWSKFFKSPPLPKLHISSRSSKLFHKQQLSDRAERWFKARAKGSGVAGGDVYLRLFRDQLTVSLDATGDALFKRGAKQEVGKAPLRENLAALMLKLVTQGAPPELMKRYELVDPMAGSGTLLIEAMGGALTPRPFAFESWPAFGALKKQPSESTSSWGFAHLLAIDKDSAQFGQLEKNLAPFKRKGHRVTWLKEDSLKGAPQLPGGCLGRILVVNPPFGGRVKSSEKPVQSLSKLLENFKPWRAAFIVPESWKIRQFEGYRLVERLELDHGGLKVQMVALAQEMPLALGPIAAEVASDHQIEQHHD